MVSSRVSPLAVDDLLMSRLMTSALEALGGDLEGGAGARRVLEEQVEDALAAQQRHLLDLARRDFHEGRGGIENLVQDGLGQAFDGQQMGEFAVLVQLRVMHVPASRRVERHPAFEHQALAVVERHIPGAVGRRDRQFATAAVGQHGQFDGARATVVEQFVDRRPRRAAGVEHVIDQDDVAAFDIEGNHRRPALRVQALLGEIVAVEGNVDQADLLGQAEQFLEALGDPGAAAVDADQRRVLRQLRTDQVGQLATLGLGIRRRALGRVTCCALSNQV